MRPALVSTAHCAVLDHDPRRLGVGQHDGAVRLRGMRVADRHLPGVEVHVVADPQRGLDAVGLEERVQRVRLCPGDELGVEPGRPAAGEVVLEHRDVRRPAGDLEAARVHPVERLARVVGERADARRGEPDEIDHELALAQVADHARRAGRGLRGDLVALEHRRFAAAPGERERGGRAQAARADHDDVGRPAHGSATAVGWPIAARNSSLAPDVQVVASSTAANPTAS
jgi:hypothetical protein